MAIVRDGARIVAALTLIVLGAFLAINACGLAWFLFSQRRPAGTTQPHYWIQIGTITLEGWKIYALAAFQIFGAIGSVVVGFSLLSKGKEHR